MKVMFEFKCTPCNEVFEALTEYTKTFPCPKCHSSADKIISLSRVSLEGHTGSFPGAALSWEKRHIEQAKKEAASAKE